MNTQHIYKTAMKRRTELLQNGLIRYGSRMDLWFHPEDYSKFMDELHKNELDALVVVKEVMCWRGFQVHDAPEVTDEGTVLLKIGGDVLCRIQVQ